jgi:hypothetical protein
VHETLRQTREEPDIIDRGIPVGLLILTARIVQKDDV